MLYKKSKLWFHTEQHVVLFYKVVNKQVYYLDARVYYLDARWTRSGFTLEMFEERIQDGIIVPVI